MLHLPVLLDPVKEMMSQCGDPKTMIDGTFGRGGHTRALLETYKDLCVLGVDQDPEAIAYGKEHFEALLQEGRLQLEHSSYLEKAQTVEQESADLILLDLGVSSPQLDQAHRGFSFYQDGPLDMRMNPNEGETAADILNTWSEEDLNELFKVYGEIRSPFRVVRAAVHDRKEDPYQTTQQFSSLVERVDRWKKKGRHPATQYFLALRLFVNQELQQTKQCLGPFIQALKPGGVFVVLTFHSLEDRIVKVAFKEAQEEGLGRRLNKKVIVADEQEQKDNPRARSAKLRAFQKEGPTEESMNGAER